MCVCVRVCVCVCDSSLVGYVRYTIIELSVCGRRLWGSLSSLHGFLQSNISHWSRRIIEWVPKRPSIQMYNTRFYDWSRAVIMKLQLKQVRYQKSVLVLSLLKKTVVLSTLWKIYIYIYIYIHVTFCGLDVMSSSRSLGPITHLPRHHSSHHV